MGAWPRSSWRRSHMMGDDQPRLAGGPAGLLARAEFREDDEGWRLLRRPSAPLPGRPVSARGGRGARDGSVVFVGGPLFGLPEATYLACILRHKRLTSEPVLPVTISLVIRDVIVTAASVAAGVA